MNRCSKMVMAMVVVSALAAAPVSAQQTAQTAGSPTTQAQPTTQAAPTTPEHHEDGARIRFGIDGGLGFGILAVGDVTAAFGALAAAGRIGVQFDGLFGLYYQAGAWLIGRDAGPAFTTIGIWTNTANIDFTFGNFFQLGVGGGVALFGAKFDAFPTFDTRIAIQLGSTGPGARGGLVIGLRTNITIDVSGPTVGVLALPLIFAGFELD